MELVKKNDDSNRGCRDNNGVWGSVKDNLRGGCDRGVFGKTVTTTEMNHHRLYQGNPIIEAAKVVKDEK